MQEIHCYSCNRDEIALKTFIKNSFQERYDLLKEVVDQKIEKYLAAYNPYKREISELLSVLNKLESYKTELKISTLKSESETLGNGIPLSEIQTLNGRIPNHLQIKSDTTINDIIEHFTIEMSADWTPITLKKELQDLANSLSESDDLLQNISENELFVSVGFSKLGQLPLPKKIGHISLHQCVLCRDAAAQVGPMY
jgi:prefoldin subunit 5